MTLMKSWIAPLVMTLVVLPPRAEPPARHLTPAPLKIAGELGHISAAGEFPGGGVIVTDQSAPAVWLIAAATGALTKIGSAGGGERQYIQPGGVYRGAGKTLLVLDRAQQRVLVLSPAGAVDRVYSIAVRGRSGGSDADLDLQHLDAADLAYFVDRQASYAARLSGSAAPDVMTVVRFDAARQQPAPVITDLRVPEEKSRSGGPGLTLSQQVIGSPADGWGVTPDGRLAIVRAKPYRVEWRLPSAKTITGPVIAYDVLPMTDAEKQARIAAMGPGSAFGASVGGAGNGTTGAADRPAPLFKETKPPFEPNDVAVSPDATVWVLRTAPLGAKDATYDVFDSGGQRVDRVAFPAGHRVVGFGEGAVFVREPAAAGGHEVLRKYVTR